VPYAFHHSASTSLSLINLSRRAWKHDSVIPQNRPSLEAVSRSVGQEIFRLLLIPNLICLLTATGLTPGGSSTVHIYTQTIHGTTQ